MEKHTLKIYDTEAIIYDMPFQEVQDGSIKVEGLPSIEQAESILFDRDYTGKGARKFGSYVAKGFAPINHVIVLADNIDKKQMANILISLGMVDGVLYDVDINQVSVTQEVAEPEASVEISDEGIHITAEEFKVEKDKKKRRR
jgi:hypothetical protein